MLPAHSGKGFTTGNTILTTCLPAVHGSAVCLGGDHPLFLSLPEEEEEAASDSWATHLLVECPAMLIHPAGICSATSYLLLPLEKCSTCSWEVFSTPVPTLPALHSTEGYS